MRAAGPGVDHTKFIEHPVEPGGDVAPLTGQAYRLVEHPADDRRSLLERGGDLGREPVDGTTRTRRAHRHIPLNLEILVGLEAGRHRVLDLLDRGVAVGHLERIDRHDRVLRHQRRHGLCRLGAVLALGAGRLRHLLRDRDLFGLDELGLLRLRRLQDRERRHHRFGPGRDRRGHAQQHADMHAEAHEPGWRVAVERGLLLTRLLLPPAADVLDWAHDYPRRGNGVRETD